MLVIANMEFGVGGYLLVPRFASCITAAQDIICCMRHLLGIRVHFSLIC